MEKNDPLEMRSEEFREILGTPPGWLLKSGILVIALVLAGLLLLSWFYKYPDLQKARIVVLSENPPVTVFARATGKLDSLFVTDQQTVGEGQLLGVIENPARIHDVYALWRVLDSLDAKFEAPDKLREIHLPDDFVLGEIHPYYTMFATRLDEYVASLEFNVSGEKSETLKQHAAGMEVYHQQLTRQVEILEDKLEISRKQLARDTFLYKEKTISEIELEKTKNDYLNTELEYRTSIAELTSVRIQITQTQRQIAELQTGESERRKMIFASVSEKYENLCNQIMAWEQRYVLRTPVSGKVTFTHIWKINQQLTVNTAVFTIVPEGAREIFGRIVLPVKGSGKVKAGQVVNIKLDNFPHLEYGMLRGRISRVSLAPVSSDNGDYYMAEVSLEQDLKTTYNRVLPFSQEMQGEAEIITSDRPLFARLVAPFLSLYRERMLTN